MAKRRSALTRREFLRATALAGAGALARVSLPGLATAGAATPRIVIIGGGLAGLTTAYRLTRKYRIPCTLYEAQDHVGGRVGTIEGFAGGQWAERGGQFVSSGDRKLRRLIRELGARLIDTFPNYPEGAVAYRFGGQNVAEASIMAAVRTAAEHAYEHYDQVYAPATYLRTDSATQQWDGVSVAEWIDDYCPGGLSSEAGEYLRIYFEGLYAGPVEEASALHIIYDFALPDAGYNERYVLDGGGAALLQPLAAALPPDTLQLESALRFLERNLDGTFALSFDTTSGPLDIEADIVVLALPFTALRDVDYAGLGLDDRKTMAIEELGMGVNSKLNLQFHSAFWEPARTGEAYTDLSIGSAFASQIGLPGSQGLLTLFGGAATTAIVGGAAAHGPAPAGIVGTQLAALEQVFPGATSAYNGIAELDVWTNDPWVKGSYSFYKTGQMTTLASVEAEPRGNLFFAGEHTARYKQRGTMNGAVESGERAAREVRRAAR